MSREADGAPSSDRADGIFQRAVLPLHEHVQRADAAVVQPASASGIEEVMGYRVYLGSEQWQVRWADDGGTSWERLGVLDTESLRDRAAQLRAASTGGSS